MGEREKERETFNFLFSNLKKKKIFFVTTTTTTKLYNNSINII
jgi:hypothetical protein